MLRTLLALMIGLMLAAPVQAASVHGIPIKSASVGAGRTVVLVHGWTCDSSSWDGQVAELSKTHRVITLDLPGHGATGGPADGKFSMALFADAVEAVRAEAGAEKIVLVGHSMGAVVIQQYALKHPDRVAGLVAVDGPLDLRIFPANVAAQMPSVAGPQGLENRRTTIRSMFVPATSPALQDKIMTMMMSAPEATAVGARAAMFEPALRTGQVIQAPALSVYAGTGLFARAPAAKDLIPRWETTSLAGTGHFLMMEQPDEFNRLLKTFLETRAEY